MNAGTIGEVVDSRYRILRQIGRGGTATVFLARDLRSRRAVALKALREDLAQLLDPALLRREIAVTSTLNHRSIVPVLDSGTWRGWPYFVMPYIRCRSLRHRLGAGQELTWRQLSSVIEQVTSGLDHAHDSGVVHLDIKPENILLSRGRAFLADFGIARVLCRECQRLNLPQLPAVLGTPAYMSPEQALGSSDLDHRSDIYSLAGVLFEVLTGEPPFLGSSPERVLFKQVTAPVPSVRELRPELTGELDQVLRAALAKEPDERPGSSVALSQALGREAARYRRGDLVGAFGVGKARPNAGSMVAPLVLSSA